MVPPLVLDIDGTLTRPDSMGTPLPIDPRVFDPLANWPTTVVLATGKAFPFPVALGQFIGLERALIAETGGIACYDDRMEQLGNGEAARAVKDAMVERGYEPTVDSLGFINRWRETEAAFDRTVPLQLLRDVAETHDLHVIDTGYAYHVKDPTVSKGRALEWVVDQLEADLDDFVAIGDSINDVSLFDRVGQSFALANADDAAQDAATHVTEGTHAVGTLEALAEVEDA